MHAHATDTASTLKHGFDALLKCDQTLEHCIAAEQRQPRPDPSALRFLGRERHRLKGELARYDGLFRTLARGRTQN